MAAAMVVPMPEILIATLAFPEHTAVGQLHGRAQAVAIAVQRPLEPERPGMVVVFRHPPQERADGIESQGGRHLARLVAAHPIGHDHEPETGLDEETVLVVRADAPGMR